MVAPKGAAPPTEFPGKAVMTESKKGSSGFKKGGKVKDKDHDQMASGGTPARRMDKKARGGPQLGVVGKGMAGDKSPRKAGGGAVSMRGRSPLSSASNISPPAGGTNH